MSHSVLRHRLVAMMCLTNRCVLYIARVSDDERDERTVSFTRDLWFFSVIMLFRINFENTDETCETRRTDHHQRPSRPPVFVRLVPTRRARRTTNSSYNTQPTGQAVGDARSVRKRVRRNALEGVIDRRDSVAERDRLFTRRPPGQVPITLLVCAVLCFV